MSYDYDGMVVDLDEGYFIIFAGGTEYQYEIEEHGDLLVGAVENGVSIEYIGGEADETDIENYYKDNYGDDEEDGYTNYD